MNPHPDFPSGPLAGRFFCQAGGVPNPNFCDPGHSVRRLLFVND